VSGPLVLCQRRDKNRRAFERQPLGRADDAIDNAAFERSYLQWCADTRAPRPESRVALGVRMSEMYSSHRNRASHIIGEVETWPPGLAKEQLIITTSGRPPGYLLYSLDEARARFAEIRGVTGDWTLPIMLEPHLSRVPP